MRLHEHSRGSIPDHSGAYHMTLLPHHVTEYGTALTTILPILFLYLNTVRVTAGTFEP